jgi:hypothetical protein
VKPGLSLKGKNKDTEHLIKWRSGDFLTLTVEEMGGYRKLKVTNFILCTPHHILMKDGTSETCSMDERDEKFIHNFSQKNGLLGKPRHRWKDIT